ncbi:hypothetical protein SMACR_09530 [Sordaria macrospora]|uniref:Uncharacterized protein n=1 Tax=Sordaria macrospora TaxID=5147 RepID=A0A8S9A1F9_SORMA|nr:hypothetical protein SMACR_09530 [Sordaria macrospora]WPJ66824.1 hypothetical protein SMAC4_09530 [Sordaria macrospora]
MDKINKKKPENGAPEDKNKRNGTGRSMSREQPKGGGQNEHSTQFSLAVLACLFRPICFVPSLSLAASGCKFSSDPNTAAALTRYPFNTTASTSRNFSRLSRANKQHHQTLAVFVVSPSAPSSPAPAPQPPPWSPPLLPPSPPPPPNFGASLPRGLCPSPPQPPLTPPLPLLLALPRPPPPGAQPSKLRPWRRWVCASPASHPGL